MQRSFSGAGEGPEEEGWFGYFVVWLFDWFVLKEERLFVVFVLDVLFLVLLFW